MEYLKQSKLKTLLDKDGGSDYSFESLEQLISSKRIPHTSLHPDAIELFVKYIMTGKICKSPTVYMLSKGVIIDTYTEHAIIYRPYITNSDTPVNLSLNAFDPQSDSVIDDLIQAGFDKSRLSPYKSYLGKIKILTSVPIDSYQSDDVIDYQFSGITLIDKTVLYDMLTLCDYYLDLPESGLYDPCYYLLYAEFVYFTKVISRDIAGEYNLQAEMFTGYLPRFGCLASDDNNVQFKRVSYLSSSNRLPRAWLLNLFESDKPWIDLSYNERMNRFVSKDNLIDEWVYPFGIESFSSEDYDSHDVDSRLVDYGDYYIAPTKRMLLHKKQIFKESPAVKRVYMDFDLYHIDYYNEQWFYSKLFIWSYLHGVIYRRTNLLDWDYEQFVMMGVELIDVLPSLNDHNPNAPPPQEYTEATKIIKHEH